MNACFADSFFFIALLSRQDAAHERALQYVRQMERGLLTTPWVLTEVADACVEPWRRREFLALMDILNSHENVVITEPSREGFDSGLELFAHRMDKSWSLTDCISFRAMEAFGISEALTGDHHFEQAGFVALLK